MHAVDHVTLSDRIDRVLLHPVIGVLVFLAVLFVVFQATTTLASPMQDWIDVTFRGWCADGLDLLLGRTIRERRLAAFAAGGRSA